MSSISSPLTIAVMVGTARERRESVKVACYIAEFGRKQQSVEVILVDPRELDLPEDGDDIHDSRFTEITARSDAFVIVTPEYNHSYPGSLKRALDSEFDNYWHKPVALVGVSSGDWGGVRACEALLPVCHTLGMIIVKPEIYFPHVQDIFAEDGAIHQEYMALYTKRTQRMYDELLWMARLFKGDS